jgi:hypothetical protein
MTETPGMDALRVRIFGNVHVRMPNPEKQRPQPAMPERLRARMRLLWIDRKGIHLIERGCIGVTASPNGRYRFQTANSDRGTASIPANVINQHRNLFEDACADTIAFRPVVKELAE